ETALAGARLLCGGVLERHPDLRVILAHGGGALPYLRGRLDHGDRVRPETRARAAAPLDGLRRLYYDTIVFDTRALRYLVETVGAAQVVLGTDDPFDMAEAAPLDFVEGAGLAPDDARAIPHNGDRLVSPA
ncbi:MAG TPA: amidohydrolase family protein, partial [Thermomicrobiales bacterium]|nr:amidohydrolase family protein [Thermomicrobiales bacterium]